MSTQRTTRVSRNVNGVRLYGTTGAWDSADGLFHFVKESHSGREGPLGWYVRSLLGDFADVEGHHEPLMLDNGKSWAPTLSELVGRAYRLKWEWLRSGQLKREGTCDDAKCRADQLPH